MYILRQHKHVPSKTTNLIVLGVLVPLLPPLSSCSLNLATYQTQQKIKNIAKAPNYRVLLSSLSFCPSPKILSSPQNYRFPLCPTSILSLSVPSPLSLAPFFLQQSFDLTPSDLRCFIQKLFPIPQRRSNPIPKFAVTLNRLHQCRPPCKTQCSASTSKNQQHLMQDQSKSSRHATNGLIRQRKLLPWSGTSRNGCNLF